jgi:hypothetical protein
LASIDTDARIGHRFRDLGKFMRRARRDMNEVARPRESTHTALDVGRIVTADVTSIAGTVACTNKTTNGRMDPICGAPSGKIRVFGAAMI